MYAPCTIEELEEAADRLGWESPIKPSKEAVAAIKPHLHPGATEADLYRLAQVEEMFIRYHRDRAEGQ